MAAETSDAEREQIVGCSAGGAFFSIDTNAAELSPDVYPFDGAYSEPWVFAETPATPPRPPGRPPLTEEAWLTDHVPLGEILSRHLDGDAAQGTISERKLLLLGCAFCRLAWHLIADGRAKRFVELVERFVDGRADRGELERAIFMPDPIPLVDPDSPILATYRAELAVATLAGRFSPESDTEDPYFALPLWLHQGLASHARNACATFTDFESACRRQDDAVRDLFAPFASPRFDPNWRARNGGAALNVARHIYDERAFGDLPILADALEDAGCDRSDVIEHLRGSGPHYLGCWALDLVLGLT